MRRSGVGAFALGAVACFQLSVSAEDLSPPSWRGEPGTTFQAWDFSDGASGPPDGGAYFNPYGVPHVSTAGDVTWLATPDDPIVPPRPDVLKKKKGGTVGHENTNTAVDGISAKLDCIQITFFGEVPTVSVTARNPGDELIAQLDSLQIVPLGDGWFHATFLHTLSPNPSFTGETYTIDAVGDGTLWIDEVIIDTQAVPEPAGLATLAVAGVTLRRRRR